MGDVATEDRGLSSTAVLLIAASVVVALFVVLAVQLGTFARRAEPSAMCRGLGSGVQGLDIIRGANGISASGPAWIAALGGDGLRSDRASQQRIATAVAADRDGFDRMVHDLAPEDRAAFAHLRAVAIEPDSPSHDPAHFDTARALRRLTDLGISCGIF